MDKIFTPSEFTLYKYFDFLIENPKDTIAQTYSFFVDKGYFDLTYLYKMFYDKSLGGGIFHYETIFTYLFICLGLYLLNRFILKIELFNLKFFEIIFPSNALKTKSFKLDLCWFVFNLLKINAFVINVLATIFLLNRIPYWLSEINFYENSTYKFFSYIGGIFPDSFYIYFVFIIAFLVYDFAHWFGHYLLHKIDFLWPFHQIHHYPRQLTIIATLRAHPIDGLFLGLLPISLMSVVVSLITPFDPSISSPSSILEKSNVLYILLITFPGILAIFNHTGLPLTYGKYLGKIFISPMAHMIHHSRLVVNKNMGATLSIWDIMFGTYYEVKTSKDYFKQQANVGLPEVGDDLYKSIFHALIIPFKTSFNIIIKKLKNLMFYLNSIIKDQH